MSGLSIDPEKAKAVSEILLEVGRGTLRVSIRKIIFLIVVSSLAGSFFAATFKFDFLAKAMPLGFLFLFLAVSVTLFSIAGHLQMRDELKSSGFREIFPLVASKVAQVNFPPISGLGALFPKTFLDNNVVGASLLEMTCSSVDCHAQVAVVLLSKGERKRIVSQRFLIVNWFSSSMLSRRDAGFTTFSEPFFFQLPPSGASDLFSKKFGEDGARLPAVIYTSDSLSPNTSLDRLHNWMDKVALSCKSDGISFHSDGNTRSLIIPVNANPFTLQWSSPETAVENHLLPKVVLLQNLLEYGRSLDDMVLELENKEANKA